MSKAEWQTLAVPDSPPPPPAESLRTLRAVIEERCWGAGDTAGLQSNAALEQLSYYDQATAAVVAHEAAEAAGGGPCLFLNCPCLFFEARKGRPDLGSDPNHLLDFDPRYRAAEGPERARVTVYDPEAPPTALPRALHRKFSAVVAEPAEPTEESLARVAKLVVVLARGDAAAVFLLVPESLCRPACSLDLNLRPVVFRPQRRGRHSHESYLLLTNRQPSRRLGGFDQSMPWT